MSPQLVVVLLAALGGAQAASTGRCAENSCRLSGELRHLHHYYEELNCKPVYKGEECCPVSYDCSHMASRDKSRCYFKGQTLDVKPDLTALDPGVCLAGCLCRQTKEAGAVATLTCAHIECPTLFQPTLVPEGCVATYSTDKCCSDGILCPQNTTAQTTKCEWKGKTYLEGEKFYPEDEPCKTCICQKGFDGTLEGPWCKKVTCGLELHYTQKLARGCAPVFLEQSKCCPIEWRCPSEDDTVVAAVTSKNPAEAVDANDATCKWGSLTLRRGESLSVAKSGGICNRCRCDVPPHVTCDTDGKLCDALPETLPVVAAEVAPADTVKMRLVRSPNDAKKKLSCKDKQCVTACVMRNGEPECV